MGRYLVIVFFSAEILQSKGLLNIGHLLQMRLSELCVKIDQCRFTVKELFATYNLFAPVMDFCFLAMVKAGLLSHI